LRVDRGEEGGSVVDGGDDVDVVVGEHQRDAVAEQRVVLGDDDAHQVMPSAAS